MRVCMSIAGSDSSAGAGIQADLKTFAAHAVYGVTAITAVTVQNTVGVEAVQEIEPRIVQGQIRCLFQDMPIHAVKIGMVFNTAIMEAIADVLNQWELPPVVLDPVMVSKSGYELLQREARTALQELLLPLADICTPNLHEAELLTGRTIRDLSDMEKAAQALRGMGAKTVVLKGGHLGEQPGTDVYCDDCGTRRLEGEFIPTSNTHGTGCTFSSALAANLALGCGHDEAAPRAKKYISAALRASQPLGRGKGPVAHLRNTRLGPED